MSGGWGVGVGVGRQSEGSKTTLILSFTQLALFFLLPFPKTTFSSGVRQDCPKAYLARCEHPDRRDVPCFGGRERRVSTALAAALLLTCVLAVHRSSRSVSPAQQPGPSRALWPASTACRLCNQGTRLQ